jgi:hypothetical protein
VPGVSAGWVRTIGDPGEAARGLALGEVAPADVALTATLIADADGVFSPADFNDRLLLGLKGTMSEAERHLIRARLDRGLRNKAQRGELRTSLPVGLDRDEDGRIVLCPDEQVRHAIERVFALWRRLGSARQVVAELVAEDQRSPRRAVGQRWVRWARASYGAVHDLLTNPAYAGAFVFGRTRTDKRVDEHGEVKVRTVELPLEQWSVFLPEHHPGYVSWPDFLATRERLRSNVRPRGEGGGAAREGAALLQGLLRCRRCGRRMQVAYSGTGGRSPRYACVRGLQLHGTDACQSLGGGRLDTAVAQAFLEAVTPAGIAATARAVVELEAEHDARLSGQRLALERAEFEADRARLQFDACEPNIASWPGASKARWRTRWPRSSASARRWPRSSAPAPLTDQEHGALARLARDLPKLWHAATTSDALGMDDLRASAGARSGPSPLMNPRKGSSDALTARFHGGCCEKVWIGAHAAGFPVASERRSRHPRLPFRPTRVLWSAARA